MERIGEEMLSLIVVKILLRKLAEIFDLRFLCNIKVFVEENETIARIVCRMKKKLLDTLNVAECMLLVENQQKASEKHFRNDK